MGGVSEGDSRDVAVVAQTQFVFIEPYTYIVIAIYSLIIDVIF